MTEAAARAFCRTRDRGVCRVPGCAARSTTLHHIVFRSHLAPDAMWDPANLLTICPAHHALVHAGLLRIEGDANGKVAVTGDDFDLVALSCDPDGDEAA